MIAASACGCAASAANAFEWRGDAPPAPAAAPASAAKRVGMSRQRRQCAEFEMPAERSWRAAAAALLTAAASACGWPDSALNARGIGGERAEHLGIALAAPPSPCVAGELLERRGIAGEARIGRGAWTRRCGRRWHSTPGWRRPRRCVAIAASACGMRWRAPASPPNGRRSRCISAAFACRACGAAGAASSAAAASASNDCGLLGERGERLRIGHQRGHHLRLGGQRLEARAGGERAEVGILDHQLERVGLHQFGDRGVAERDVAFADLRGDVAVGRGDRALRSGPSGG